MFVQVQLSLPVPVDFVQNPVEIEIQHSLVRLNAPSNKVEALTDAVYTASAITRIDPLLLVALMYTESNFNLNAVSSLNYKGLMQTPYASMKWADVDVLIGARILREKITIARNDVPLAVALYKGGNNTAAKKYASETLRLYRRLKSEAI